MPSRVRALTVRTNGQHPHPPSRPPYPPSRQDQTRISPGHPATTTTLPGPWAATAASIRAVDVYHIQHHAVGRCWARRAYGGGRLRRPDTEVPTHSPGGRSEAADRKRGTPSGGRVRVTVQPR